MKISKIINPYRGLSKEIYILALGRMVNAAGSFIFPLLTLILTGKLGINKTQVGYILTITGLFHMFSGVIGGKLTDCFGRKKIIVVFNILGASLYIFAACLGTSLYMVPVVIIASFLMGIAGPASGGLIADITTPKNRDGAYSLFYMAMNVGFTVSPILGGLMMKNYLWLLFILDGGTSIIAVMLTYIFIPESMVKTKEKFGEDRKDEKQVEGSTLKVLRERPILVLFSLVMFGYNFVYSQWSYLYPLTVSKMVPSNGASFYGSLVSFNAIIVIFLTPIITKFISGKKAIGRIFTGGILYTVGFGMVGFVSTVPFIYASVIVLTLGEIVVTTSSNTFLVNHTPASHRGRVGAVLPIIMGLGFTLGPSIMGTILRVTSIENGWRFVGVIMLIFSFFTYTLYCYDGKKEEKAA